MHEKLIELKNKLEHLHSEFDNLSFPQENLIQQSNYRYPFLHANDLAYFPIDLASRINKAEKFKPNENEITRIDALIDILNKSPLNIQYLSHSNQDVSSAAITSYLCSMLFISNELFDLMSFDSLSISDKSLLPKNIIRRLDAYNSNLDKIHDKTEDIEERVRSINDAYEAAESLPTTMIQLREAAQELTELKELSQKTTEDINLLSQQSKIKKDEISKLHDELSSLDKQSAKLVDEYLKNLKEKATIYIDKCEEAFRTTTSKGLAGAFENKAIKLNKSIRWWVAGLTTSLILGAIVGYLRLNALEVFLASPDISTFKLATQLLLSMLSIGAPIWFAWLATKQIGQRFRLAEDYEYKASVSKAYEGYRREALNLDGNFTERLFDNALTRLEEPPLRFVEVDSHSSPIMEIICSDNFKKFIENGDEKVNLILEKVGLKKIVSNESTQEKINRKSDNMEVE